jgi:predicted DNA-binding protein
MSTSIRISVETKRRLIRMRGKLEIKDGKSRSIEDVINELIGYFEKTGESLG